MESESPIDQVKEEVRDVDEATGQGALVNVECPTATRSREWSSRSGLTWPSSTAPSASSHSHLLGLVHNQSANPWLFLVYLQQPNAVLAQCSFGHPACGVCMTRCPNKDRCSVCAIAGAGRRSAAAAPTLEDIVRSTRSPGPHQRLPQLRGIPRRCRAPARVPPRAVLLPRARLRRRRLAADAPRSPQGCATPGLWTSLRVLVAEEDRRVFG